MTRFITPDEMIGGCPRGVWLALRRVPPRPFDADTLAAWMRPEGSTAHGRALLSALIADGLAEPDGDGWALTRSGAALAASTRKPITRPKAGLSSPRAWACHAWRPTSSAARATGAVAQRARVGGR